MDLDENDKHIAVKVKNLQKAIEGDYRHNWIIDNLPAASLMETAEASIGRDLSTSKWVFVFHVSLPSECACMTVRSWLDKFATIYCLSPFFHPLPPLPPSSGRVLSLEKCTHLFPDTCLNFCCCGLDQHS